MMPILLPVRVRRSVRDDDGCGNTTRGRPGFDRAREFRPRLNPQLFQHRGIVVERMAGQEEADRLILAAQSLGRQPWLDLRQRNLLP